MQDTGKPLVAQRSFSVQIEGPPSPCKQQYSEIHIPCCRPTVQRSEALKPGQVGSSALMQLQQMYEARDSEETASDDDLSSNSSSDSKSSASSDDPDEYLADHFVIDAELTPVFIETPRTRKKHTERAILEDIRRRSQGLIQADAKPMQEVVSNENHILQEGMIRRAAEQVKFALLKNLSMRQPLRLASRSNCTSLESSVDSCSSGIDQRIQVCKLAVNFTMLQANTLGILKANMTLRAPKRRHTSAVGDLRHFN